MNRAAHSEMRPVLFEPSARGRELADAMREFLLDEVLPAERSFVKPHGGELRDRQVPEVIETLKNKARQRGLWNLFLPEESGIGQLDYSFIAEISGWSLTLAPEAINCQAPDTGNMELLHLFGTDAQKKQWLEPLLDGSIRSAFAMTEPAVASSDPTNIETTIVRDGDHYVISGRKWWTTGAADPRCRLLMVMGKTDLEAPVHRQQSIVLIPIETPGVRIVRDVPVIGSHHFQGHCEIDFHEVRVPVSNRLGDVGAGFAMAQARLGPGRIHHCMRAVGAGERALTLMVERSRTRSAFGAPLAKHGMVQEKIAWARIGLDRARLICQKASAVIDLHGNKAAATLVSQAKVDVTRTVAQVVDDAIQVFGAAGVSDDAPLADTWAWLRALRLLDGPDEVHLRTIAQAEMRAERDPRELIWGAS